MQYGHLTLDDRRNMDNGSTNFQSHVPSINGALGHSHGHIPSAFSRAHAQDYRVSPSPPVHNQQNGGPSSQLGYSVPPSASPPVKRKHVVDGPVVAQSSNKRRREADDGDGYDDSGGQGAKHWTDDEKSKLFKWLMGPGQDDRWNALRATKNSCLRECAHDVFGGKKTYQALKGCYERNFNLFKQIYSYETYHGQTGSLEVNPSLSDTESLREYERRLTAARKAGCDVGNISARTLDQWQRNGWYELFYKRWHGDPATTRQANSRIIQNQPNGSSAPDDTDDNDDHGLDFTDSLTGAPPGAGMGHDRSSLPMTFMNPSDMQQHAPPISPHHPMPSQSHTSPTMSSSTTSPSASLANTFPGSSNSSSLLTSALNPAALHTSSLHIASPSFSNTSTLSSSNPASSSTLASTSSSTHPPPPPSSAPPSSSSSDQTVVNISVTQAMVSSYLQYLQVQTQTSKMKLEYMRKRDEREERESQQRRELEKLKLDREKAEFDHKQSSQNAKQKADRAIELLSNPAVDNSTKEAASAFLKRLLASD